LIEDDWLVARTIQEGLAPGEFIISHVPSLATAERQLQGGTYRLIILDLTLPDGDGLDLVASLRSARNETPILVLTARDSVLDRLIGFDHGVDDYLGKPFDVNELAARLRVMVRRSGGTDRHLLQYADLELDLLTRSARRPSLDGSLSDREVELLSFMMRRPEEILAREYLLDQLWGDEVDASSNLVNVYVNLLRNKIESPRHVKLIHTVRLAGYMLSVKGPDEVR
jgi:two-component system response regulator QseB